MGKHTKHPTNESASQEVSKRKDRIESHSKFINGLIQKKYSAIKQLKQSFYACRSAAAGRLLSSMRWKCKCAYDGTDLYGWQSQAGGNTVQDFLESRLEEIFKQPVRVHGSGRTDSGVHALGQVFHFDADWRHPAGKLLRAMQTGIPSTIQVTAVEAASHDFHARFSACGKQYEYRLCEGLALPDEIRYTWSLGDQQLDVRRMSAAAQHLLGEHDFTAFSANRGDGSEDNPVKDLRRLDVQRAGQRIQVVTEASGYLYKMVRSLVGALVQVGTGQLTPGDVEQLLRSKQRMQRVTTAPAKGLWLMHVFY